ncbi:stalk domain-containing protein [Paenibacillus bovis]|uniref:Glycosyl hydrolase n=1 Tax=Paenibacillus bovis TaxID=1616788 RepID=A0A172ZDY9_9BACL|nr:stalk domain-containing protein [Paenibacillus bovis]ANF95723.1 glycosyl hydrolase [Paenibacillus bovis]
MNNILKLALCSSLLCTGMMSSSALSPATHAAAPSVSITLDGYNLPFPVAPTMVKGTTMVPFRAIAEALGIPVSWNQASKTITATATSGSGSKKVVLTMNSTNATVDGQKVTLAVAPQTINNNTMIPLSFFSQQFGAAVKWDASTRTVSITSPAEDLYTLGFYAISSYDERATVPDFDTVAYGWSRITTDGKFSTSNTEFKWPQASGSDTPESIIQNTAAQGTSPYLMVYSVDGHGELTKNLENPTLQNQNIQSIIDTATTKGFKGIVLDFEGLGWSGDKAKAQSDYNAFVKNIATKAHQQGLKLTLALHPLNSSYTGYDYKTLGTLADDLIIMAYDYTDKKTPEPTDKVDNAIQLALKQVDRSKLILGISLSSEDENSVNTKIGLAKRYDLKGVAIWRLGIIGQKAMDAMHQSVEFNK